MRFGFLFWLGLALYRNYSVELGLPTFTICYGVLIMASKFVETTQGSKKCLLDEFDGVLFLSSDSDDLIEIGCFEDGFSNYDSRFNEVLTKDNVSYEPFSKYGLTSHFIDFSFKSGGFFYMFRNEEMFVQFCEFYGLEF
jgi:hypothetical protein